jgi:peptidoglycan/LPS O-acetylase OafA/YrhL
MRMVVTTPQATVPPAPRLLFLDALRAFASVVILLHHFAIYPPLGRQAQPLLGPLVGWFQDYARMTQVFFVVGGFVMASCMTEKSWSLARVGCFLLSRYCRLVIPCLAAIILAIAACAASRGWLMESVVGPPPSVLQFLAHVFLLQDILGIESFSAGLWFVCIYFQLGLIHALTLYVRDFLASRSGLPCESARIDIPMIVGWGMSAASVFYFNRHAEWDTTAFYFYAYFFMGVILQRCHTDRHSQWIFWLFMLMMVIGMCYQWRLHTMIAIIAGLLVFAADKTGLLGCWPENRVIARLGLISYSLFLVHFPVWVLVSGLWVRFGWNSPWSSVAGLLVALVTSLALALVFHRFVEIPAGRLSHRCAV